MHVYVCVYIHVWGICVSMRYVCMPVSVSIALCVFVCLCMHLWCVGVCLSVSVVSVCTCIWGV